MKIENKLRVIEAIKEHNYFKRNLEVLYEMKEKNTSDGVGILIQEYSDTSGLCTDYFYKHGNYDATMTDEILTSVIAIVEKYNLILEDEIENL